MDILLLREAVTVLSFIAFVGIIAWAMHPSNAHILDRAGRIPLEDDHE